jgi:phosphonate transport system substrate-binding protein
MRCKINGLLAGLLFLVIILPAANAFAAEKPIVYFGVTLRYDPIAMYERYQPLMDYLTRNTSYKFELKIGQDYAEVTQFLVDGKTDVASIGDGGLLQAMLTAGVVPIVAPLNKEGKPYYRSCVVVPANTDIRSLQDLKGKNIALGYHHSTTGNLVPRRMLLKQGIHFSDLGSVTNMKHHSEVAWSVLKGKYDAGFVKESTALRLEKNGLQILSCSDELPSIPLIARHDAPPKLRKEITAALVKLDRRNPTDRKMMENWSSEYQNGFVPAVAADYSALTTLFKSIPYGCGTGCHK